VRNSDHTEIPLLVIIALSDHPKVEVPELVLRPRCLDESG